MSDTTKENGYMIKELAMVSTKMQTGMSTLETSKTTKCMAGVDISLLMKIVTIQVVPSFTRESVRTASPKVMGPKSMPMVQFTSANGMITKDMGGAKLSGRLKKAISLSTIMMDSGPTTR